MTPPRGAPFRLRSALGAVATALALGVLPACGPGGDGAAEEASEQSTSRTGGIFGGTVQPPSSGVSGTSDAPPMSTPGRDAAGTRGTSEGAASGEGIGAGPTDESRSGAAGPTTGGGAGEGRTDITDMGYTVGAPDAPIQVVEFSDFGCGYCRRFHLSTYPTLHEEYVETGRVAWKYIPFVLGIFPNGEEAAIAGECVLRHGRRAFPEFRDRLFQDQPAWRDSDDPTSIFVDVAAEAGADPAPLRRCIEGEGTAEQVRANIALGRRIGLRGTPSFLVNGFPLHGAQPLEVFRSIFGEMLSGTAREEDGP